MDRSRPVHTVSRNINVVIVPQWRDLVQLTVFNLIAIVRYIQTDSVSGASRQAEKLQVFEIIV